jgi:enoyl-CoA hydratase
MREITLRAPGKNALDSAAMQALRTELVAAAGEPILLTGAGEAFSAGLNLKEVAELDAAAMRRFIDLLEDLVLELYTYPGPTVALVNGHAIAGGTVLALCCDYRIAHDDPRMRIGLNEVALGVRFPPRILRLARARIPLAHRERVLLGAELVAPRDALAVGLIDEVSADAASRAREHLATLARHPAATYAATKRALRAGALDPTAEERAHFLEHDLPGWTAAELKQRIDALLKR